MKRGFIVLFLLLLSLQAISQTNNAKSVRSDAWQKTRILFIVDCSKSMNFKWQSNTKIKIVQTIITNIIDSLNGRDNVELALRTFGNNEDVTSETCSDSYLDIPFSKNNMEPMKSKLKALIPKGTTPLAYSLSRCEEDFPDCDNCRNIVILITDGMDDCNENPCEVSATLLQQGKILTPFVVGIGSALRSHLECIGNYHETTNEIEFSQVLNAIIAQLLDRTTCQVDLLDNYKEATETNIPISFYDHQSQLPKYTYMHTFNEKGLSDTLILDPLQSYDLVVHTIPQVKIENIKLLPAKHTIIPAQVPQGSIVVRFAGKNDKNQQGFKSIPIIIRKFKTSETVNVQQINETAKYITGNYDIEVLTTPRLNIDSIEISQNATTTIEIPLVGTAQINKGDEMIGSLFVKDNGRLRWVYNLNDNLVNESLQLLPGEYTVVLRKKKANNILQTVTKDFKIASSQITTITINETERQKNKR